MPRFHHSYSGTIATGSPPARATPISWRPRLPVMTPPCQQPLACREDVSGSLGQATPFRGAPRRRASCVGNLQPAYEGRGRAHASGARGCGRPPRPSPRSAGERVAGEACSCRFRAASCEGAPSSPARNASARSDAGSREAAGRAGERTSGELPAAAWTASTVGRKTVRQPRRFARISQSVSS